MNLTPMHYGYDNRDMSRLLHDQILGELLRDGKVIYQGVRLDIKIRELHASASDDFGDGAFADVIYCCDGWQVRTALHV
jgi:hypothetical protein